MADHDDPAFPQQGNTLDWLIRGWQPNDPETGHRAELFLRAAATIFLETLPADVNPILKGPGFELRFTRISWPASDRSPANDVSKALPERPDREE